VLPARVRPDQTGIDREAFAAYQPLGDAARHRGREQPAHEVAVAEATVPILGEGRMVGHLAVEPQSQLNAESSNSSRGSMLL
jgi:hypothetical protein